MPKTETEYGERLEFRLSLGQLEDAKSAAKAINVPLSRFVRDAMEARANAVKLGAAD